MPVRFAFNALVRLVVLFAPVVMVGAFVEDVGGSRAGPVALRVVTSVAIAVTGTNKAVGSPRRTSDNRVEGNAALGSFVGPGMAIGERGIKVGEGGDIDHIFAARGISVALVVQLLEEGLAHRGSELTLQVAGLGVPLFLSELRLFV